MNKQPTRTEARDQGDISAALWSIARHWRTPSQIHLSPAIDWERLIPAALFNRMQSLLSRLLADPATAPLFDSAPAEMLAEIKHEAARLEHNAEIMGEALSEYLARAALQRLETVVLKGLWLSYKIYGDPRMRPGGDVDILVRKKDINRSLLILEEMGYGRWWPNLLQDAYYARHHLHFQRSTPDLKIWFEPHWAFDHPYTVFTVDYDGMLDRTQAGRLLGQPLAELSPPDLLLSLSLHLVKHAVFLPAMIHDANLDEVILADGMLMYFLDVHEVILHYGQDIDWAAVATITKQAGASVAVGSVLWACKAVLGTPIPTALFDDLTVQTPGRVQQFLMRSIADYQVKVFRGQQKSSLWDFLLVTNGAFVLRPIRVLDTLTYLFPGRDYHQRRYGSSTGWTRLQHLLSGTAAFLRFGWDTLYFGWERHRRLRKLNLNPSIFNRLETE